MAVMGHVSRPLVGLLVAVVAFFGLWIVALKPTSSSSVSASPSAASPVHAGSRVHAPTSTQGASPTRTAKPAITVHAATPTQRLNVVQRALAEHKVLALLFYNPAAAVDQAVRHELGTIATTGGRVVEVAIPLDEIAGYPVVTNQVTIQGSPTLVIIDSSRQAFTLVGFADRFEIAHRIEDALSLL